MVNLNQSYFKFNCISQLLFEQNLLKMTKLAIQLKSKLAIINYNYF